MTYKRVVGGESCRAQSSCDSIAIVSAIQTGRGPKRMIRSSTKALKFKHYFVKAKSHRSPNLCYSDLAGWPIWASTRLARLYIYIPGGGAGLRMKEAWENKALRKLDKQVYMHICMHIFIYVYVYIYIYIYTYICVLLLGCSVAYYIACYNAI